MVRSKLLILALTGLGLMLMPMATRACEFEFEVNNVQEQYRPGDEITVTVLLQLTHRNCPVKPEETQFGGQGIEILGATQWVQISSMVYARKFKIRITNTASTSTLMALRECEKDGGKGSIVFRRAD